MMKNKPTICMKSIRLCLLLWCFLLPPEVTSFIGLNIGGVDQGVNTGSRFDFDNVRFDFHFGLPEGASIGQTDVEALLCRTQDYLGTVLHNEFPEEIFEVKATGINWERNNDDPLPVTVNFTATLSGANGTELASTPITPQELQAATASLDMDDFLTNIVQASACPSGFSHSTKVEYNSKTTPDVEGSIEEPQCQTTCVPTLTPGVPTIAPTKQPADEPSTNPPKETYGQAESQMRPDHTRNPSSTPNPISAVNPAFEGEDDSPSDEHGGGGSGGDGSTGGTPPSSETVSGTPSSSTQGTSVGSSGAGGGSGGSSGLGMDGSNPSSNGGPAPSGPIPIPSNSNSPGNNPGSDPPVSTSAGNTPSGTDSPTTDSSSTGQLVYASGFGMGEEGGSGSTSTIEDDPGNGILLSKEAQGSMSKPQGTDVEAPGDEPPSEGTDGGELASGATSNNEINNAKQNTDSSSGSDPNPSITNPNQSHAESGQSDMIFFTITLSFFEGKEGEPTMTEIKSLICYTQDFFADELQKAIGDPQITFQAIDIDWVYNADGANDFQLRFAANALDESGARLPENEVFQSLKVAQGDLQDYIYKYAWKSIAPKGQGGSVFREVKGVNLQTMQNVPIPNGELPQGLSEACDTFQQEISKTEELEERSFESSTGYISERGGESVIVERSLTSSPDNESPAGSESPSKAQITLAIKFFDDKATQATLREIKSLICYTQDFFGNELKRESGDSKIDFRAIDIGWTSNSKDDFELKFAANVSDGTGMPTPNNEVFQSLKVTQSDLQNYMADYVSKTQIQEGQTESFFYNVKSVDLKLGQGVPTGQGELPDGISEPCQDYQTQPTSTPSIAPFSISSNSERLPSSSPSLHAMTPLPSPSQIHQSGGSVNRYQSGGSVSDRHESSASVSDHESGGEESTYNGYYDYRVMFTIQVGFYEGHEKNPSDSEIDGAVCALKSYIREDMQHDFNDNSAEVTLYMANLTYSFAQENSKPLEMVFLVEATFGNGTQVHAKTVFDALKLRSGDLVRLIRDHLYFAPPDDSVFHHTAQMGFNSHIGVSNEVLETSGPIECPDDDIQHTNKTSQAAPKSGENTMSKLSPKALQKGKFHSLTNRDGENPFNLGFGIPRGTANADSSQESAGDSEVQQKQLTSSAKETTANDDSSQESTDDSEVQQKQLTPSATESTASASSSQESAGDSESQQKQLTPSAKETTANADSSQESTGDSEVQQKQLTSSAKETTANADSSQESAGDSEVPQSESPPSAKDTPGDTSPWMDQVATPPPSKASSQVSPTQADATVDNQEALSRVSPNGADATADNQEALSEVPPNGAEVTADDQVVVYSFVIGSYKNETLAQEPSEEEMMGLMCQAKNYFTDYLSTNLQHPNLEVSIVDISWSFNEDCYTPLNVEFGIEATFGVSAVSPTQIYETVRLGDEDLANLIENYVWESSPNGSPFSDVKRLTFEASMGTEHAESKIEKAICPETVAPAESPGGQRVGPFSMPASPSAETEAPAESPGGQRVGPFSMPTSPSEENPNPILQPSYKFVFGFYEGKEGEPTASEVEALICETNSYFEDKLRESTGDTDIEAHAVNISWKYLEDCYSVAVTFGMEAAFGNGELMSPEEIFGAFKLGEGDMKVYIEEYVWESEPKGSNLFSNANQLGFEDFLGAPMPEGQLAYASCPAAPPGASHGPAPGPAPSNGREPGPAPAETSSGAPNPEVPSTSPAGPAKPSRGGGGPSTEVPSPSTSPAAPAEPSTGGGGPSPEVPSTSMSPEAPASTGLNRKDPFSIPTQSQASKEDKTSAEEMPTAEATAENAILYHLLFNFDNGTLHEPTPNDIESFICETTEFFEGEIQKGQEKECIGGVDLTKIDWTYNETCHTAPVTVTFAAQSVFCDGKAVPVEDIYDALKLDHEELGRYLTAYLWTLDENNVFSKAMSLSFEGKLHSVVRPGKIAEVDC